MPELNPGFLIVLAGLFIPLLPQKARRIYIPLLPVLSFLWLRQFAPGEYGLYTLIDTYTLTTLRVDRLSLVFCYVFHLALFLGSIYSLHVKDTVQQVAGVIYGGGTIAGVLAGDWFTLFVCWELVAVASTFLIWARRTPRVGQQRVVTRRAVGVVGLARGRVRRRREQVGRLGVGRGVLDDLRRRLDIQRRDQVAGLGLRAERGDSLGVLLRGLGHRIQHAHCLNVRQRPMHSLT